MYKKIYELYQKTTTITPINERQVNNMKKYRIQVFHDNTCDNTYFDSRDEAIIFGTTQLAKQSVIGVFLLCHIVDDKYDVEMQIQ